MYVSATEFRSNVGKYLELSSHETIYIVKHGKPISRLSGTNDERKKAFESLIGSFKYDGDPELLLEERLKDYENLV
jgi:antitoxin (DNA-binding transcriptional repressor) of toxin-antitoxin stability system